MALAEEMFLHLLRLYDIYLKKPKVLEEPNNVIENVE